MIKQRLMVQKICFSFFRIAVLINGAALAVIVYFILSLGWRAISWEFLSQAPRDSMTAGGILPCIVGTIVLCLMTIFVALPIGVASAIYLNEYAAQGNANKRIAKRLNISEQTVKNDVGSILRKLGANDRTHAVVMCLRNNWIFMSSVADLMD